MRDEISLDFAENLGFFSTKISEKSEIFEKLQSSQIHLKKIDNE